MPRRNQAASQSQTQASQRGTQLTLDTFTQEAAVNIDDQANDCVRYILQKAGQKMPFRKSDLQKNVVLSSSRNFEVVIQKTIQILRNVYGFNLVLCDGTTSNRAYILSNALPFVEADIETNNTEDPPSDVDKILLTLILSHIFMTSTAVGEASMNSFLLALTIDVDRKHPVFGSVKDHMATFLKQKYLHSEIDPVSKKASYSWGQRAEKEISKNAILNFVCKIYKDCTPNGWTNQFQVAQDQGFENYPLQNGIINGDMEVDDE